MSTATREERLARRVADLYATDEQFANARPSEAVTAATEQPGLRLPQIVPTVMAASAERQSVPDVQPQPRFLAAQADQFDDRLALIDDTNSPNEAVTAPRMSQVGGRRGRLRQRRMGAICTRTDL